MKGSGSTGVGGTWFSASWFTVLTLALLPPLGVTLMWRYRTWRTPAKLLLSTWGLCWTLAVILPKDEPVRQTSDALLSDQTQPDQVPTQTSRSDNRIIAAQQAAERERLQAAEAERERKEAAALAAEAQRKAGEEYEVDGLVLLLKTLKGSTEEYGGEITGVVVNRRNREVGYAQISFNLYDASGAQVGSAFDNITNLEAGGKWRFKANAFGTDFVRFRFAELTGY
ncbi:MAG: hypothetical protein FJ280_13125 [Planctomycetes bacterium]|nr:hypothetical protein [Planctomycetota bacterium]